MRKLIYTLGVFTSLSLGTLSYAQIGINNEDPHATLDITAKTDNGNAVEGLLIPRVSKVKAELMGGNTKESTLVYINEVTTNPTSISYTSNVDSKGFYYFEGSKWQKVGGNGGSSTKQNWEDIRTAPPSADGANDGGVITIENNRESIPSNVFFAIVDVDGNVSVKLPDATNITDGRMLTVYKGNKSGNLQVQDTNGKVGGSTGSQLIGNGAVRWANGRTFIVANHKWYPTTF